MNIQAIETRIRELQRSRNQADLEWVQARRHAAKLNAFHQAKLGIAERKLKEAKARHREAIKAQRGDDALDELKDFATQFNHDSERLAGSLNEAKRLLSECNPADVRCDSVWSAENLPLLLENSEGQIIMRKRGI